MLSAAPQEGQLTSPVCVHMYMLVSLTQESQGSCHVCFHRESDAASHRKQHDGSQAVQQGLHGIPLRTQVVTPVCVHVCVRVCVCVCYVYLCQ